MELAIPILALGGLYIISKQQTEQNDQKEAFNAHEELPNTNIPNRNYVNEYPIINANVDLTSKLSNNNRYDGPQVYTDKYFNPTVKNNVFSGVGGEETPIVGQAVQSGNFKSLTGETVGGDYFRHANMVPYFGGKIRSRQVEANAHESIMDNYLGTGSQSISKKEQSPMFAPNENVDWAYGAPNQNEFYQSRVNASSKMANVKPFAEERVGPGLGLGYTTEGSAGFNSGMMARETWLPKTTNELRVDNKPKSTGHMLIGHEGPAISRVTNLGSIGNVEKNRPERAFESGEERWFTTTGVEKSQPMRAIPIERYVNRPETATDYIGGAGSSNPSTYTDGEYMPSKHIDLGAVPLSIANSVGQGGATDADYGIKSKFAYPNNRSANQQTDYFGAVGGAIGSVFTPLLDMLRPSRRENVIGSLRPYENPGTKVPLSYIFNPADRPNTTIRETTENSKFHLNVNGNQLGGAYKVSEHQPIQNERMNQSDFYYAGNASAGERGREARPYDAEYRQRNNDIKSSTINGRLVKGNMALMNGSVNMQGKAKDDYLHNKRAVNPSIPGQTPSLDSMGKLQGKNGLYQNLQYDRTTPDMLDALKGNPYALSVTRGI